MSGLNTDLFFFAALEEMAVKKMGGRIFSTARTTEDEREDRVPYIIITHEGMENTETTKDDVESVYDKVQVGVTIVADDREELARLMQEARERVRRFFWAAEEDETHEGHKECPIDYIVTATGVEYDPEKPCYYQTLYYECTVLNTLTT